MAFNKSLRFVLPLLCAGNLFTPMAGALDYARLKQSAEPQRAARYEQFERFQIKGICGTTRIDLAAGYGANTIRTYVPPTREQLDKYQRIGLKVIVGIWMPHHGENMGKDGKWTYDYVERSDDQVKSFAETVERIGNHPAILMWCLGNEVHLEPAYLETVNRMSQKLHELHPKQLTSITIINAPQEKLALIRQHAPDLDVIGYNSYGHGALGGASKNLESEWGRAYYVSEFGPQGPWWGRKTSWGAFYEQAYDAKLDDLRQSFKKIDAAPLCLGSTMFLWGSWTQQKPTYFSAFLNPTGGEQVVEERDLYVTPMVEEFCNYWSGKYPAQRGPVLTKINVGGHQDRDDVILRTGEAFKVTATATAGDQPATQLQYRWWILDKKGSAVFGPLVTDKPTAELKAPNEAGTDYVVMVYVIAPDRRASGFTLPIKVENGYAHVEPPAPNSL
jgi:hypothetical protein